MPKLSLRPLAAVLAVLALAAAGCGGKNSSGGFSSPPAGVQAAIWTDYCTRNASLTSGVQQALNGTLSAAGFVPLLNGIEQSITKDANGTQDPTKTQFHTLASAIDGVKVAVSTGVEPDYTQITAAIAPIPTCNK